MLSRAALTSRVPLFASRGRAVGLLHAWQGGYAKTVSRYGERVQRSPIRPLPSVHCCDCCGLIMAIHGHDLRFAKAPMASKFAPGEFVTFSMELVFLRCLLSFAINVSPHLASSQSMPPRRTGPRPFGLRPAVGAALAAKQSSDSRLKSLLQPFPSARASSRHRSGQQRGSREVNRGTLMHR